MLAYEVARLDAAIRANPHLEDFFGNWLSTQVARAKDAKAHHILVDYLTSPYGLDVAAKLSSLLEDVTTQIPSEIARLRKKLVDTTTQAEFESALFELEIAAQFASRGYPIQVEPLRSVGGKNPDFRVILVGQEVFLEAKKLQADSGVAQAWSAGSVVQERLKERLSPLPISITFSVSPDLHKRYQERFLDQLFGAVDQLDPNDPSEMIVECLNDEGNLIGRARVSRSPTGKTEVINGGWARSLSADDLHRQETNLAERYLGGEQFPASGWHVLVMDTSKLMRGESLMQDAWASVSSTTINALVLCQRQGYWMNGIGGDVQVLQNPNAPLPDDLRDELQDVFSSDSLSRTM